MLAAGESFHEPPPRPDSQCLPTLRPVGRGLPQAAGAGGFWRGLGVGFLSAFFLFDYALAQGAGMQAIVGFAARNGTTVLACAGAAIGSLALGRVAISGVRSERERRGKLKHVRERLGI